MVQEKSEKSESGVCVAYFTILGRRRSDFEVYRGVVVIEE